MDRFRYHFQLSLSLETTSFRLYENTLDRLRIRTHAIVSLIERQPKSGMICSGSIPPSITQCCYDSTERIQGSMSKQDKVKFMLESDLIQVQT